MSYHDQRLTDLLALSYVPRWSIVARTREQSVADHTFRVCVILCELAAHMDIALSWSDLWYAMTHDGAESRTGDVVGIFKHRHTSVASAIDKAEIAECPWMAGVPQPGDSIKRLVKIADLIEGVTFIERWGTGPHARKVAALIERQLRDEYCRDTTDRDEIGGGAGAIGDVLATTIGSVLAAIRRDREI